MKLRTFKGLGALLLYPGSELVESVAAIAAVLEEEALLSPVTHVGVVRLIESLQTGNLLDLEENYVQLFDRSSQRSLYLFEHAYGDARERGAAMVELQQVYAQHGWLGVTPELPDYLPLFCEFLTLVPGEQARLLLAETVPILAVLQQRMAQRESRYAAVFGALIELAGVAVDRGQVDKLLAANKTATADNEPTPLDCQWEARPVAFGADEALPGCGNCPAK